MNELDLPTVSGVPQPELDPDRELPELIIDSDEPFEDQVKRLQELRKYLGDAS